MSNALLIAEPQPDTEVAIANGITIRPLTAVDMGAVAETYRRTYLGTPEEMTRQEALDEIEATWAGEYGCLIDDASLGAWSNDELTGVILTVLDPPWDDVPRGPFILDLFVIPAHRRLGIGRALVQSVQHFLTEPIALRVENSATAARTLYSSLGFRPRL